jgi:hypothetical protein
MTAMGYVDSNGEDAVSSSVTVQLAHGTFMVASVVLAFILGCWIGPARGPDRLRATATLQPAPVAVPVLLPSNYAEMVRDRKAALLAAEGPDLDLLVIVEAPPGMSAKQVADQAAELANRLRCKIEVQYGGRKVQARPGMSREGFAKQCTKFSFDDGIGLAIMVAIPTGCWLVFLFLYEKFKSKREP